MEHLRPITDWLYYTEQISIADFKDKRIILGVIDGVNGDDVMVDDAGANFTDYLCDGSDDEHRIELFAKALRYFVREGAPDLSDDAQKRHDGLASIIEDY